MNKKISIHIFSGLLSLGTKKKKIFLQQKIEYGQKTMSDERKKPALG